jgi:hypothetical protein
MSGKGRQWSSETLAASHREACNEHLLGEFARAGGVELALKEEADIGRLMRPLSRPWLFATYHSTFPIGI